MVWNSIPSQLAKENKKFVYGLVREGGRGVPVELKAEVNLKAKSLKTYREKFNPEIAIRISMADYKAEDRIVNLSLYAVEEICRA